MYNNAYNFKIYMSNLKSFDYIYPIFWSQTNLVQVSFTQMDRATWFNHVL
jgi:hypothetical protein